MWGWGAQKEQIITSSCHQEACTVGEAKLVCRVIAPLASSVL